MPQYATSTFETIWQVILCRNFIKTNLFLPCISQSLSLPFAFTFCIRIWIFAFKKCNNVLYQSYQVTCVIKLQYILEIRYLYKKVLLVIASVKHIAKLLMIRVIRLMREKLFMLYNLQRHKTYFLRWKMRCFHISNTVRLMKWIKWKFIHI